MDAAGSVTGWIEEAKAGESLAVQRLWERYFEQLLRIGRRRLGHQARRVADEEDVALSALNSFFAGAKQGRYPQLADRHNLWRLLVLIADRKAIDQINYQRRQKRGGGHVRGQSACDAQGCHGLRTIEDVVGTEPTPAAAALLAEQFQRLLALLADQTLRRLALLKLEGHSNEEIAATLQCSLRTVERKLALIRAKWSEASREE
jgi:DNA-directed RNA polymerase specialized sigma24 family protein